jgi:hypothetical protein
LDRLAPPLTCKGRAGNLRVCPCGTIMLMITGWRACHYRGVISTCWAVGVASSGPQKACSKLQQQHTPPTLWRMPRSHPERLPPLSGLGMHAEATCGAWQPVRSTVMPSHGGSPVLLCFPLASTPGIWLLLEGIMICPVHQGQQGTPSQAVGCATAGTVPAVRALRGAALRTVSFSLACVYGLCQERCEFTPRDRRFGRASPAASPAAPTGREGVYGPQ